MAATDPALFTGASAPPLQRISAVGGYVASEGSRIIAPGRMPLGNVVRPIIYCHGSGNDYNDWEANCHELFHFARHGIPTIVCKLGSTTNWGNDTSLTRIGQAWTYVKAQLPVKTDKMILWGQSMGSVAALRYARANPANVAAVGLVVPAIGLDDIHDNDRLGAAAAIEAAYTNLATYDAAVAGSPSIDPSQMAAAYQTAGVPTYIQYGETDPTCLPSFATAFDAACTNVTSYQLPATAHVGCAADIHRCLDWLLPYTT